MLRQALLIFFFVITTVGSALAVAPATTGLYLTFEQRLAFSYALLAQGEPEAEKEKILGRAKTYFKGMLKQPVETVVVRNFAEFLIIMRGDWPETHSLALDIEILEKAGPRSLKMYTAPSERIQSQIQRYMTWQNTEMMKMAASQKDTMGVAAEHFGGALKQMMNSSSLPLVKKVAETWLLEQSEAVLADRMQELDRVGQKVAESSFAQQQDPTMRILMQTLLGEYFSRLSPDSKKLIVSSFIGGDLLANDMMKFEIMVQNSGTVLQKTLQVLARQANLPPAVVEVFRGLESSVRPVSKHLVEEILRQESGNYDFTSFEKKHLGVGSVAQVNRAKINYNGRKDVVARFIKPGAEARTEEDRRILNEIAPLIDNNHELIRMKVPKLAPVVNDIVRTVTTELDQEDTKQRQREAKVYNKTMPFRSKEYQSEIRFHVPEIYEPKGSKQSKFMVQEMVIGGKLDEQAMIFKEAIPELKRVVVEAMAKVWAQEALFGSGFYHSDLHQGNFLVNVAEPQIVVNILDFGMGGKISPELQRQVMVLGVGTDIISGDLIGRAFWDLSDKRRNNISEAEFKREVNAKAENIRKGREPNISMELWMAWALNRGLGVPYDFVSLNRGMGIVNKLLSDSSSKLDLTKITKSLAKENPMVVYNNLVVREKISLQDLVKLGWSEMKTVFRNDPPKQTAFALPTVIRCEAVFH